MNYTYLIAHTQPGERKEWRFNVEDLTKTIGTAIHRYLDAHLALYSLQDEIGNDDIVCEIVRFQKAERFFSSHVITNLDEVHAATWLAGVARWWILTADNTSLSRGNVIDLYDSLEILLPYVNETKEWRRFRQMIKIARKNHSHVTSICLS